MWESVIYFLKKLFRENKMKFLLIIFIALFSLQTKANTAEISFGIGVSNFKNDIEEYRHDSNKLGLVVDFNYYPIKDELTYGAINFGVGLGYINFGKYKGSLLIEDKLVTDELKESLVTPGLGFSALLAAKYEYNDTFLEVSIGSLYWSYNVDIGNDVYNSRGNSAIYSAEIGHVIYDHFSLSLSAHTSKYKKNSSSLYSINLTYYFL
ncbi:hypothetical protein PLEI_4292 [Photobacterium leiognathi lrivu.4.1]|uniref:Outer membrane protein beta-barrel domain-containing protein n=2 Tax=Photobacterium leiognathi TaxID=553611 RepID=V5F8Q7_PHOLE|nr:hypothetical protein PLEI_4292 [Photobacterium leiognathi lrivu.4.1]